VCVCVRVQERCKEQVACPPLSGHVSPSTSGFLRQCQRQGACMCRHMLACAPHPPRCCIYCVWLEACVCACQQRDIIAEYVTACSCLHSRLIYYHGMLIFAFTSYLDAQERVLSNTRAMSVVIQMYALELCTREHVCRQIPA
jgi:hypothetical protein